MSNFLTRLYRILLYLYPRSFRTKFCEEMASVFAEKAGEGQVQTQIALHFLRELRDLPGSIINIYTSTWTQGGVMSAQNETISPISKVDAAIGMLPFLGFGLATMLNKADNIYHYPSPYAEIAVYFLVLIGLLVGWIRGFPLWSYSYLGWALVLAWSHTNLKVFGVRWGYQVWIPFGITGLIALLWTRSLKPIKKLFGDIWVDWTRLSLMMYCLGAWVYWIFDENHHPYLVLLVLVVTLAVSTGVWFFLRSSSIRGRILSITTPYIATMVISHIAWSTWDWRAYFGFPPKQAEAWYTSIRSLILPNLFWIIIIFWPVIIQMIRRITLKPRAS